MCVRSKSTTMWFRHNNQPTFFVVVMVLLGITSATARSAVTHHEPDKHVSAPATRANNPNPEDSNSESWTRTEADREEARKAQHASLLEALAQLPGEDYSTFEFRRRMSIEHGSLYNGWEDLAYPARALKHMYRRKLFVLENEWSSEGQPQQQEEGRKYNSNNRSKSQKQEEESVLVDAIKLPSVKSFMTRDMTIDDMMQKYAKATNLARFGRAHASMYHSFWLMDTNSDGKGSEEEMKAYFLATQRDRDARTLGKETYDGRNRVYSHNGISIDSAEGVVPLRVRDTAFPPELYGMYFRHNENGSSSVGPHSATDDDAAAFNNNLVIRFPQRDGRKGFQFHSMTRSLTEQQIAGGAFGADIYDYTYQPTYPYDLVDFMFVERRASLKIFDLAVDYTSSETPHAVVCRSSVRQLLRPFHMLRLPDQAAIISQGGAVKESRADLLVALDWFDVVSSDLPPNWDVWNAPTYLWPPAVVPIFPLLPSPIQDELVRTALLQTPTPDETENNGDGDDLIDRALRNGFDSLPALLYSSGSGSSGRKYLSPVHFSLFWEGMVKQQHVLEEMLMKHNFVGRFFNATTPAPTADTDTGTMVPSHRVQQPSSLLMQAIGEGKEKNSESGTSSEDTDIYTSSINNKYDENEEDNKSWIEPYVAEILHQYDRILISTVDSAGGGSTNNGAASQPSRSVIIEVDQAVRDTVSRQLTADPLYGTVDTSVHDRTFLPNTDPHDFIIPYESLPEFNQTYYEATRRERHRLVVNSSGGDNNGTMNMSDGKNNGTGDAAEREQAAKNGQQGSASRSAARLYVVIAWIVLTLFCWVLCSAVICACRMCGRCHYHVTESSDHRHQQQVDNRSNNRVVRNSNSRNRNVTVHGGTAVEVEEGEQRGEEGLSNTVVAASSSPEENAADRRLNDDVDACQVQVPVPLISRDKGAAKANDHRRTIESGKEVNNETKVIIINAQSALHGNSSRSPTKDHQDDDGREMSFEEGRIDWMPSPVSNAAGSSNADRNPLACPPSKLRSDLLDNSNNKKNNSNSNSNIAAAAPVAGTAATSAMVSDDQSAVASAAMMMHLRPHQCRVYLEQTRSVTATVATHQTDRDDGKDFEER